MFVTVNTEHVRLRRLAPYNPLHAETAGD